MRWNAWGLVLFVPVLVLTGGCAEKEAVTPASTPDSFVQEEVIYGDDGRQDTYEILDASILARAASSVALVQARDLERRSTGIYRARGSAYGPSLQLCRDERFYDQIAGAFCSGSLIGPDLILTAGHCVTSSSECQKTSFVFDYALSGPGQSDVEIPADNIYSCSELIHTEVLGTGSDFAVVRLDRSVTGGRHPLRARRSGSLRAGEGVYVIGHPSGLPQKITQGGSVRSLSAEHFTTNLDTYGGNSGSPVFNTATGDLEGVLVRGAQDFIQRGSCVASHRCSDGDCEGEDVTLISRVAEYLGGDSPLPPSPAPPPASSRAEYSRAPNLAIPDNDRKGIASTLTADQGPEGRAVQVAVEIEHSYRGDLVISLTSPDGRTVVLHRRGGGSKDDLRGTYGVDLTAVGDLGEFRSLSSGGDWTLQIVDQARLDKGRLIRWSLIFE